MRSRTATIAALSLAALISTQANAQALKSRITQIMAETSDGEVEEVDSEEEEESPEAEPEPAPVTPRRSPKRLPKQRPSQAPEEFKAGELTLTFEVPSSRKYQDQMEYLRSSEVFQTAIQDVDKNIKFPRGLDVAFSQCGEANAFYISSKHTIVMCYELFEVLLAVANRDGGSEEEVHQAAFGSMLFFFYHELGHALVDILDIPITGREEDAVDDLAALTLIEAGEDGSSAVESTMAQFDTGDSDVTELAFWDEHSLDSQRFYNLACMLYGSDTEYYEELVGDDGLPQERAERCPDEFQQKSKSWERLLGPHLKAMVAKARRTRA